MKPPVPKSHFDCPKFKLILFSYDGCINCPHLEGTLTAESANWRTKKNDACNFKKDL